MVVPATTRECEQLFRRDLERRGHRFIRYKKKFAAALSVLQCVSNTNAAGAAVTVTITTTAGNLLVICSHQGANTTSTLAMTDSSGQGGWLQTASGYATVATRRFAMFYRPNSAALTTVTATWSGGITSTIDLIVYEVSGADLVTPEDSSVNVNGAASSTTITSAALTTANANDILFFGAQFGGVYGTLTQGAGFTLPAGSTQSRSGMQYSIVSSIQSGVTTSMTCTTTQAYDNIFAAFKAAGGGSPALMGTREVLAGQVAGGWQ